MKLANLRRFLVFVDGELVAATDDAREAIERFDRGNAGRRAVYTCSLLIDEQSLDRRLGDEPQFTEAENLAWRRSAGGAR